MADDEKQKDRRTGERRKGTDDTYKGPERRRSERREFNGDE